MSRYCKMTLDKICALLEYYAASRGNCLPTFRDKVSACFERQVICLENWMRSHNVVQCENIRYTTPTYLEVSNYKYYDVGYHTHLT